MSFSLLSNNWKRIIVHVLRKYITQSYYQVPALAQEASGGKLSPEFSLDIEGDLSMDLEFFVQRLIPIPQSRLPACVSPNLC